MTKRILAIVITIVIILVLFIYVFKFFIIVEPGERAIIFNRVTGSSWVIEKEGFKLLAPILWKPTIYNTRIRTYTMSSVVLKGEAKSDDALTAVTSDGETVKLDLSIRYHPDPNRLHILHRLIGPEYENLVVRPQVGTMARMVVASFPVSEVYSIKRQVIQDMIFRDLSRSMDASCLVLDEVLVRNIILSEGFQKTIEEKQNALRMKYLQEKQDVENAMRITAATGEAEAIRLKGKALAEYPSLIQYEYVKLLSPSIQAIVTDHNAIFNFSDFLKKK